MGWLRRLVTGKTKDQEENEAIADQVVACLKAPTRKARCRLVKAYPQLASSQAIEVLQGLVLYAEDFGNNKTLNELKECMRFLQDCQELGVDEVVAGGD